MNLFPFAILMLCLPFGTSLQSLAVASVGLYLLISQRKNLKNIFEGMGTAEKINISSLLLVILLPMLATILNPKNPEKDVISYFFGFVPLLILPVLFRISGSMDRKGLQKLEKFWAGIMLAWALVLLSQHLWGWKIQGVSIVRGDSYMRSQGFYSHPLTLAYVALMIWPFHLVLLSSDVKNKLRYLTVACNLALLYFSASRTAQAVAILIGVGYVLTVFKGRTRILLVGSILLGFLTIAFTNNSISRRFGSMSTQMISEEKESPYPDDRIAFWIVHSNMIKERPLLGHGISLDRNYRIPYYDAIGLPNFKKAYEAHNQILQLAAEGGIGAALAFLCWLGSLRYLWPHAGRSVRHIRDLSILGLLLGGLTQNAYQDGEVRFALLTLLALVSVMGILNAQKATS